MRTRFLLALTLLARLAVAQPPADGRSAPSATVTGVVHDSIAHAPLAGAMVQLVDATNPTRFGRAAVADSLGRFSIDSVPDGRYTIGFFHPMLDSLGLEPTLREVSVAGQRTVRADLATPSPARLRTAICGAGASDSGAVVVGVVRDARDGAPLSGAALTAEWLEYSFTPKGLVRHMPRRTVTTKESGWFALCNVPSAGTVAIVASRGADSTDRIELQVPPEGFLRRELYVGATRTITVTDTAHRADSLAARPRRVHVGTGRLSGTVVAAVAGQPLTGAVVGIVEGPQTRANDRGEWTLADAPAGTRMLEVRAVGYYPERRMVDVVTGAASVRVSLSTLKAVLDTVRVTASRLSDRRGTGFAERSRGGSGRYLMPADIARRGTLNTTDLFRSMSGIRLDRTAFDSTTITMRGSFAGLCVPAIYIDGMLMAGISADEIDNLVTPRDVLGIEIYLEATVPPQFQRAMSGCGSIVIWSK